MIFFFFLTNLIILGPLKFILYRLTPTLECGMTTELVCLKDVFPAFIPSTSFINARVGNVGETSKSKLDFENIQPPLSLQASLQSRSPKTHKRAPLDYCWRTSPWEGVGERSAAHRCRR